MVHVDLAELVRGALTECGCDEKLLSGFDGHSTIELHFVGMPSIFVSEESGDIWLWSRLYDQNENVISQHADRLLSEIMKGCEFSHTGQLQFNTRDGFIELRGMVHKDILHNNEMMAAAFNEFYDQIESYIEILK